MRLFKAPPDLLDQLLLLQPPQEGWTYAGTVVCTLWKAPEHIKVSVLTQGFMPDEWGITEDSPDADLIHDEWTASILKMALGEDL